MRFLKTGFLVFILSFALCLTAFADECNHDAELIDGYCSVCGKLVDLDYCTHDAELIDGYCSVCGKLVDFDYCPHEEQVGGYCIICGQYIGDFGECIHDVVLDGYCANCGLPIYSSLYFNDHEHLWQEEDDFYRCTICGAYQDEWYDYISSITDSPDSSSDPLPNSVTMSSVLTSISSIFTAAIGWTSSVADTVIDYPILFICVIIPFVGLGVGLFKRLL